MKYLITAFSGLGNFIQQTAMIRQLHRYDPEAQVDLVGHNQTGALEVLAGSPLIHAMEQIPRQPGWREKAAILRRLNQRHYDVLLVPYGSVRGWLHLLVCLSNARRILAHAHPQRTARIARLYRSLGRGRVRQVPFADGEWEPDMYFDLVEKLFERRLPRDYQTFIALKPAPVDLARFNLPAEYLCVQFGAANGVATAKRWPMDHFSALIARLQARRPALGIVAVGSAAEYAAFVRPLVERHPALINTAGNTNLNELAAVLSGARLVITHDSGIMHLAHALGRPLIALYGPTDYARTAPRGPNVVLLRQDLPCSPCNRDISEQAAQARCPDPACMRAIAPDTVCAKAQEILDRPAP